MKESIRRFWKTAQPLVRWIVTVVASVLLLLAALSYELTGDYMGIFKFFRTIAVVEDHYAGSVDKKALLDGAMKGVVATLGDKHSVYLTGDDFKMFTEQMTGSYAGIGVYISKGDEGVFIGGVIEGSPASEAGLQRGDMIMAIDGQPTASMELEAVSQAIRGPEGTSVVLTIRHDGADTDMTLTRRNIHMQTVAGQMIEGTDIGYIQIALFSEDTGQEFTDTYNKLRSQGMKKMILDLRNNPGGLVDQATLVASNFVPRNSLIISYVSSDGKEDQFVADGTDECIPMAVLVNENSASASEIIAGDVQDLKLGPIIGVRTYGKGTVQGVYPVTKADAVKVTVGKYKTTKGREVDGKGIEPDIVVPLQPNDAEDYQLEKALDVLQKS